MLTGLLPGLILGACSTSGDIDAARAAVVTFHQELDDGQFQAAYDDGSPELKASSSLDFAALLDRVHTKLGTFASSDRGDWKFNTGTDGTFIFLSFRSVYTRGAAEEDFTYRMVDGKPRLAGYHIHSDVLPDTQPATLPKGGIST